MWCLTKEPVLILVGTMSGAAEWLGTTVCVAVVLNRSGYSHTQIYT